MQVCENFRLGLSPRQEALSELGENIVKLTQIGDPCSELGCNGKMRCVETEITEDRAYTKEKIELQCSVCKKPVTRYEWK